MKRTDARAVGRDRTKDEKARRHLHGEKGSTFSKGKYGVLLGKIAQTVTTYPNKDFLVAEIYESC